MNPDSIFGAFEPKFGFRSHLDARSIFQNERRARSAVGTNRFTASNSFTPSNGLSRSSDEPIQVAVSFLDDRKRAVLSPGGCADENTKNNHGCGRSDPPTDQRQLSRSQRG